MPVAWSLKEWVHVDVLEPVRRLELKVLSEQIKSKAMQKELQQELQQKHDDIDRIRGKLCASQRQNEEVRRLAACGLVLSCA